MEQPKKEIHVKTKIGSLEKFIPQNNLVICEILTDNVNSKTDAGIWKTHEGINVDQYLNQNANRIVRVVKLPEKLTPIRWYTEIELKVGDIAWVSPFDAVGCQMIVFEDKEYALISYYDFRVVKRRNFHRNLDGILDDKRKVKGVNKKYIIEDEKVYEIILLNGYVMCDEYYEEKKFGAYSKKEINTRYGTVKYIGKPNKYYVKTVDGKKIKEDLDGGANVQYNNLLLKEERKHMRIEEPLHACFNGDKVYFVIQRRDIMAIL